MFQETIQGYHEHQIANTKIIRFKEDILKYIGKDSGIDVLEIGTGSGDFAYFLCSNIKVNNMTIVDTFEGFNDIDGRHGNLPDDQKFFVNNRISHLTNLTLIKGDSLQELQKMYRSDHSKKYDFIYVDANHSFENVINDLFWSSMLLRQGGIIGIDDYCFKPSKIDNDDKYEVQEALSAFLNENHQWTIKYFSFNANGFQNVFIGKEFRE